MIFTELEVPNDPGERIDSVVQYFDQGLLQMGKDFAPSVGARNAGPNRDHVNEIADGFLKTALRPATSRQANDDVFLPRIPEEQHFQRG